MSFNRSKKLSALIKYKLVQQYRDARKFGVLFLPKRAVYSLFAKNGIARVYIPQFGTMHIRKNKSDFTTIRQVIRDGDYALRRCGDAEVLAQARYREIIAAGKTPVIVDAGANIGSASVWFATKYPQAAIVAIEPSDGNFELLRLNSQPFPNVTPIEAAIGSESGFVSVIQTNLAMGVHTERAELGCLVITIDDAIATVPDGVIFIAKIDIEGFEQDLFARKLEWIEATQLIYIEPHDWLCIGSSTSQSFQAAMGTRAFDLCIVGENLVYINSKRRKRLRIS